MTNHKADIFDPYCPVEKNVTCRIYLGSHGYVGYFQRLSKLKCQRLCDFFNVFMKMMVIMKTTCHSIPLFPI